MRKKVGLILVGLLAAGICAAALAAFLYQKESYVFGQTGKPFYNPYMGFAVNADYPDAVGLSTLVYIDITWREWEPEEGLYAMESVKAENFWDRWQAEGKTAVLRFLCDEPSGEAHMDIPDWLYEKTKDGVFYDHDYGKGYAPEYTNPVFIEAHRRAIEALGETFGKDTMVAYVELGSLGHWGEWHTLYTQGVPRMPSEEIRMSYVEPYTRAFPGARLLARRPFPETARLGSGLYNDMTGEEHDTQVWLGWIADGGSYSQPEKEEQLTAQPEVWLQSPIGGEFTSGLSYEVMLEEELDRTVKLLAESHTSFIGPKCPVVEEAEQYRAGVEKVLSSIGYRYAVSGCTIQTWRGSGSASMSLIIENYGIAPIYFPWHMYLYIEDKTGQRIDRIKVPAELIELGGGARIEVMLEQIPACDGYLYSVAVENPETGEPAMFLDMECENQDKRYYLNK